LSLLTAPTQPENLTANYYPLLNSLSPYFGGIEQAIVALIALSLFIGYMKGKHVLGKSAKRVAGRICNLPNPANLFTIYSRGYCLLILGMVGLGMGIKYLGIPNDVRGVIDVAIGAALINGSLLYFRMAYALKSRGLNIV
jgi:hypothetical protein